MAFPPTAVMIIKAGVVCTQESNGRLMMWTCWKGGRNLALVLETSSGSNMCLFIVIHTRVED